jgi:diguanylate cyclase (GGDEF)-like protein
VLLGAFGFYYRRSLRIAKSNRGMLVAAREEALTDALTGLNNRRALVSDLDQRVADVRGPEETDVDRSGRDQIMLSLFDLDGFKQYNDTFGHPAGDALLRRLGRRFEAAADGTASVYRMGGDEFCLLARVGRGDAADQIAELGVVALTERGAGFEIGCSHGSALIPSEAGDAEVALSLADERMYAQKAEGTSASRQSSDVLQRVLVEKSAALSEHLGGVGALAEPTALALGLSEATAARVKTAAQLHDVGKTGIPDAILDKPAPLEDDETAFMQRHTLIGERILRAAPSLAPAAGFVRSHHERMDGTGYPDGLAGESIPIGARIIFACDAFDAMTSDRPYRKAIPVEDALAELRRCSGTQFDRRVVDAITSQIEGGAPVEPAPQPVPI